MVTMGVIAIVLVLHYTKAMNDIALFWIAFVFTRPFGAAFGDLLETTEQRWAGPWHVLGLAGVTGVYIILFVFLSHRSDQKRQAI